MKFKYCRLISFIKFVFIGSPEATVEQALSASERFDGN